MAVHENFDFWEKTEMQMMGRSVQVEIADGRVFTGILACLDREGNVLLQQATCKSLFLGTIMIADCDLVSILLIA